MTPPRVILHVDMNAFFASVEQKSNPLLRGKPIVVVADSRPLRWAARTGGGSESRTSHRRRSVILTASYEARAFGIKTGMNLYEAKKLCPQAVAVDGDSTKYLDTTAKLLNAFSTFTDQVEMISCDEAFLDVTHSLGCFNTDGEGLARQVKQTVRAQTGLPCSVGVAPNKRLAKLASDYKKPDGLTVVDPDLVQAFLADVPVEAVSGIGRKLKARLNALGILTCGQLGKTNLGLLQHHFGFWGWWLKRMGQGLDDAPVKFLNHTDAVKSMGHSTTFPKDTQDLDLLRSYLLLLSEKTAARLRKKGLQGNTVSLVVRYKDFHTFGRQRRRVQPTDDGLEICNEAFSILRDIPLQQPLRLVGVSVSNLSNGNQQDSLFSELDARRRANRATDIINARHGKFTLRPLRLLEAQKSGVLAPPIPPYIKVDESR